MNQTVIIVAGAVAALLLIVIVALVARKRSKPNKKQLNTEEYSKRWKALQKQCATRKTWPQAIVEADDLLADVLKARRYKGKTTGERLVAAQHVLTANEEVWFAHKLRGTIVNEDVRRLKKQDIIDALQGFRQALKDLGAL